MDSIQTIQTDIIKNGKLWTILDLIELMLGCCELSCFFSHINA